MEEAGDSGDGGLDTTAIAISALAALVVLAVVVCGCFIHLKQKKAQKSNMEGACVVLVMCSRLFRER